MAVWSEVNTSHIFGAIRLDAEFYQPRYKNNESKLRAFRRSTTLGQITPKFVKGIFNINAEEYTDKGIPFVRISNLKDMFISDLNLAFINRERHLSEQKTALKKFDIVISKTAIPAASLVQFEECNTSQDIIAVQTNQSTQFNFYLVAFLNSRFGLLQMERLFQGNIQSHLSLDEARTIIVPLPDENFEREIADLLKGSLRMREQASQLYAEAETLLLDALGLNNVTVTQAVTYERDFHEVARAGRFDSPYFSPRAQRALQIMGRSGNTLGDVAPMVKRKFKPRSGEEFRYIEIGDIGGDGRAESSPIAGEEAPSRAQWIVRSKDIITSTVRPIRRLSALIEPEQDGFVCSSGFAVLKPRDVVPEVLLVYLRAPIVCEILDLHTTATMYPAIATDTLLDIPFSAPDPAISKEIVSKVRASRAARDDAQNLLESAKRRVEELIEEGG